ncbi:hypothetical protein CTAYLR_006021 [Chrysophaeum taylorii]|uniref:ODAD1 central coiled coil region domain-containing protein n=1 Tax=Chrysophaeum taylorii TaxID=2483200 RepID=A0AAD7XPY4_9STRA|nr:hypothetical protein CTAYLR_006021 [Chrysophaeum taylorii]
MEKDKAEIAQLQREFRHMELNRKTYADESYQVLRRQQATIAKLRKENEALKAELALEMRRQTMTPAEMAEMSKGHEDLERLKAQEEEETKRIQQIDSQIAAMQHKATQLRKEMGGVNAARESQACVQKQVKILENRLDQALVKFNQALAKNKELREQIDDLRRERVVFDNIYRKLERELHDKKRQMANVIEVSNLAYEQRDNYQMEIAAIEQANRKEQDDFEAQMLELNRILEDELQIPPPTALTTVASQRSVAHDASLDDSARHQKNNTTSKQKSSNNKAAVVSKEKQELQVGEERVQNFEEAFNRIKQATGITQIDELVRVFIKNEDQNFSLFNYVNEQTNEIEKLEEQLQQLRDEEQKYTQESGDDVNQHKLILQELDAKLETINTQADKYEAKCQEYQNIIDNLKQAIASCFTKLECTRSSSDLLADSTVTEANMLQHLAIIEEKCNEIIRQYCAIKAAEAKATSTDAGASSSQAEVLPSVLGIGPTTPMGQDLIHVTPPKLEDYSSEEDDDDDEGETRPLTRDELKAKTLNRMYRRGNRESAGGAPRTATKPTNARLNGGAKKQK